MTMAFIVYPCEVLIAPLSCKQSPCRSDCWRNQGWIVIGRGIDAGRNGISLHKIGGIWLQHFMPSIEARRIVQPDFLVFRQENHWHSIMNWRDNFVWLACNDGEGANPITFRLFPVFPQSGKGKWLARFEHDSHRDFAIGCLLPFV